MDQGGIFSYQEEYNKKIRERMAQEKEAEALRDNKEAAPAPAEREATSGGGGVVQTGSSVADTVGNGMMMSGHPGMMAAGLGVKVLAQGEQNRREQEEAQRQAYNERIKRRQQIMSNIANLGIQ